MHDKSYHANVRKNVIDLIPRGGKLLDAGGGTGATAAALKRAGIVDHAGVVDLVPSDIGEEIDFSYSGDLTDGALLERIGVEQGKFDTILALDFLEHLADPWAMVAKLHQLLKRGGHLIISVPNVRHYSASLPLLFKDKWELKDFGILDRTHLRFFVRDTAIALATSSGLKLEEVKAAVPPRRLNRLILALTLGKAEAFVTQQYIVRVNYAVN